VDILVSGWSLYCFLNDFFFLFLLNFWIYLWFFYIFF
jgi:hypothetical protein